ncbi:hypothetical protein POV27_14260 [Aureisphaera galaxeae]|uniref:hypothetical protein n=1 Tax=Aureisphaera galaxeae TaxID=1538023 RepID=UPI0023501501|nr:hypothetical protein [Aureisphaera galaxeae]MDC8005221.1 hypothetical protein [Aureisphaera galaxeae]
MKTPLLIHRKFVIALLIGVFSLVATEKATAQGPNAPEAGSFEPVDATDMVNLLTGDLTYVLPIMTVPGPEGGYPLSLSYHAGIGMDQEASWVGLGWNLNPGAIDRGLNGFPDDWKTGKVIDRFYDEGGTETETTISTSYSGYGFSIANSFSFNSNKGFGGSVSLGVGINTGSGKLGIGGTLGVSPGGRGYGGINVSHTGYASAFSIGGTLGTQGIGINAGASGAGGGFSTGFNKSFQGGSSFSLSYSVGERYKSVGLGISLSGSGGVSSATIGGVGIGANTSFVQSVQANDYDVVQKSSSFNLSIPSPIGVFGFGLNKQKVSWSLNEKKESTFTGNINARNIGTNCQVTTIAAGGTIQKVYMQVDYPEDCTCENWEQLIYGDDGPGPNDPQCTSSRPLWSTFGDMDIYQIGPLNEIASLRNNNPTFFAYDKYNVSAQGLSGEMSPFHRKSETLLGVNGNNLRDKDGDFDLDYFPLVVLSSLGYLYSEAEFQFINEYSSSLIINPMTFRQPGSPDEINDFINSIGASFGNPKRRGRYTEYFFNREIENNPPAGLILPDQLNIPADTEDGIGAFKITTIDGKTYHYSLAVYNHETLTRTLDVVDKPERESYFESQRLRPYATHWLLTAITGPDFVDVNANNRVDSSDYGYWVDFQYGKWSDAYIWKTPYGKEYNEDGLANTRTITHGRKQLYYLDRIKTRTHTAIFVKNTRKVDNISEPWAYKAVDYGPFPNANSFDNPRFTVPSQKTLRLDKIILVKNENDDVNKQLGSGLELAQFVDIDYVGEKQERAYFHTEDNIIDVQDNIANALGSALKVVELGDHYSYELVNGTPNSYSGRLTLHGVSIQGKGGVQSMPPYEFTYDNSRTFNINKADDWGFHEDKPDTWSLTDILTPIGTSLSITYESDVFHKTAVPNGRPINDGLKFTLQSFPVCYQTGTVRLKVEKDLGDNNSPISNIDFTELFSTSEQTFFDFYQVAYRNPPGGGTDIDWGIINVSSQMADIISVTANQIILEVNGTVHCHDGSQDDLNRLTEINPFSYTSCGPGWPFLEVPREHDSQSTPPYVGNGEEYYSLQYTLISNALRQNENGGGIRVRAITTSDDLGNALTTKYEYNTPGTSESSGIISYYPYKENLDIQIPYASELPGPSTMYKWVTVSNIIGTDPSVTDHVTKTQYKFKVLEEKDPNQIKFGDFLEMGNGVDIGGFSYYDEGLNSSVELFADSGYIENNLACVGQIMEISSYNSDDHLLSRTVNEYLSKAEIDQGILQESFRAAKKISNPNQTFFSRPKIYLNSSFRKTYPSVLKSTTVTEGNYTTTTYYENHDVNTGQVLETRTEDSRGHTIKTQSVLAYTIPEYSDNLGGYGMGSKVDDITNRNMLSQQAVNYTLLDDLGVWKPIQVGLITWNNEWDYYSVGGTVSSPTNASEKIWRKHKTFVWDGSIDSRGILENFDLASHDGFNWTIGASQSEPWQEISEITHYDRFSLPIQIKDVNNNFTSTKMGDDHSKVIASGNAGYGEMYYTGCEYTEGGIYLDDEIRGASFRSSEKAHTGTYSAKLNPGDEFGVVLKGGEHREGDYMISVWVHKDNYQNAKIKVTFGGALETFNGERVFAGDWVLMNHYFERDYAASQVSNIYMVASQSGTIYVDDFRLHPVETAMTSYVYNEYDELTYMLSPNNLGTRYEYDSEGRLITIYVEVVDTPSTEGGFKLSNEYEYNYKREGDIGSGNGGDDYPPLDGNATILVQERECSTPPDPLCDKCRDFIMNAFVDPATGSGQYSYQWQFKSNLYDWANVGNGTGSQAIFSYNIDNDLYCGDGEVYEWMEFRCIVSDPGVSEDLPLITPRQYIDCTCDQE